MTGQDVLTSAGTPDSRARNHRWRRRVTWAGVVILVLAAIGFAAGAWVFSGMIYTKALQVDPLHDVPNVVVTATGPGWVELRATESITEDLTSNNVYGLDWGTGFGRVQDLRRTEGKQVVRSFRVLSGSPPVAGTTARLTRDAYPREPGNLLGFPVRQVSYRSPAGTFPAYLADGTSDTWAILVHGRGATRSEMFRLMRVTVGAGMPSLDITYRHDPETGGGLATYGQQEWPDLQAAVTWALRHGAHHVVLAGASMGAAVTAAFLEHSPLAGKVTGVILDAPMLDFDALIRYGAQDVTLPVLGQGVPSPLVSAALSVASLRYGIDRGSVNYLDDTSWVKMPVLAFHGTSDTRVPYSITQRLASAEPGLVTAVLVPGAEHVESWNVDPGRYEQRVRAFLQPLT